MWGWVRQGSLTNTIDTAYLSGVDGGQISAILRATQPSHLRRVGLNSWASNTIEPASLRCSILNVVSLCRLGCRLNAVVKARLGARLSAAGRPPGQPQAAQ